MPEILRRNAEIHLNGSVLAFTFALSVLTGLAFGTLPALRASRPDLDALLRDAHATDSRPRRRLRSALVVAEVALSLMLLIGAGLLLRSFAKAARVDPGFDPHGLITFQLSLPPARYADGGSEVRFEQELRRRIAALPGVRAVAVTQSMPFIDDNSTGGFWVEGRPRPEPGKGVNSMRYDVTPGFLASLGGHLLRGRDLREDDDLKAPVVLIDDALARKLFGNGDPLGHRLAFPPEVVGNLRGPEIVGVFGHVLQYGLDAADPVQAGMILPYAMMAQFAPQWFQSITLLVRGGGDPQLLAGAVRREVSALDPELPIYNVKTMDAAVEESLAGRRFSTLLLALFAAVALALAAVGVYGVMSYGVVQRTREIGIRMALGARQRDVLRLVVSGGAQLAGAGIGIGIALAIGLSRVLRGMLYGVNAFDPLTYFGLALALALVALFATWLPARRAARLDPNIALRTE
jgi:predicted permease